MSKMIFVNLPVEDLAAATRFYEAVGCVKNDQFSDENASSMMWSETITFQLLATPYFSTFTSKPVADAKTTCQVLLALSADSRDDVDAFIKAGADAGGDANIRDVQDMGWMYNRAIADPDGHILEVVFMDMAAAADAFSEN